MNSFLTQAMNARPDRRLLTRRVQDGISGSVAEYGHDATLAHEMLALLKEGAVALAQTSNPKCEFCGAMKYDNAHAPDCWFNRVLPFIEDNP